MAERLEKRRFALGVLNTQTATGATMMETIHSEAERLGQDVFMMEECAIYPLALLYEHQPHESVTVTAEAIADWMPYGALVKMVDLLPPSFPQPEFCNEGDPAVIWGEESTGDCVACMTGPSTDEFAIVKFVRGKVVEETIHKTVNGALPPKALSLISVYLKLIDGSDTLLKIASDHGIRTVDDMLNASDSELIGLLTECQAKLDIKDE
jgi:hypothetical protein